MIRKTTESLPDLYESDETAWLDVMAELIRAGRLDDLDYPHLAEYLEDTAIRDRREVNSRLRVLLTHVLKWIYQQDMRTPSWQSTVHDQQAELEDLLESGVLRNHAEGALAAIFHKAVKYVIRETKLPAATFPAECPWTLEQLLAAEVLGAAEHIPQRPVTRRTAIQSALAVGSVAAIAGAGDASQQPAPQPDARRSSPRRFNMKKSINLWAFPYPERMNLRECLQLAKNAGFDGIELNYDLDNDLSPRATAKELRAIRAMAEKIGIAISGVCSFLFWPYPLSSNDAKKRARGLELAGQMMTAASELGTDNLLCVPGAVHIPWRTDHEPVPNDVCDRRARDAVRRLLPQAEKARVHINIENIFFNGYLMTPAEMIAFVDSFQSRYVKVHFDTGNIMLFQFPEHWIAQLGNRIKNTHFKEFSKKGTDHSLESFRTLLDGTTNWPAVVEALDKAGYRDWCTFEYFHPFAHYPEALIYQTNDALDRILGRK